MTRPILFDPATVCDIDSRLSVITGLLISIVVIGMVGAGLLAALLFTVAG